MKSRLWATKMSRKRRTMQGIKKITTLKWKMISKDRCIPRKSRKKEKVKDRVNSRKLSSKWGKSTINKRRKT